MFKVFNNRHPYIINNTFSLMSPSHNTRSLNKFSIFNFKKELFTCRRTLIYVGPISWNKLDTILKNISNYKLCRKVCITTCYLHTKYTYNLYFIYF